MYLKPIARRLSLENETASCKPASGGCYGGDYMVYVSRNCTSVEDVKLFAGGGIIVSPYQGPNPDNWYVCVGHDLSFC